MQESTLSLFNYTRQVDDSNLPLQFPAALLTISLLDQFFKN